MALSINEQKKVIVIKIFALKNKDVKKRENGSSGFYENEGKERTQKETGYIPTSCACVKKNIDMNYYLKRLITNCTASLSITCNFIKQIIWVTIRR